MGHNISAIILKGGYDQSSAKEFDLRGIYLGHSLTMFHINHYYSAYWQVKLGVQGFLNINDIDYILYPSERAISELITRISAREKPNYAIITTDYFGGMGSQYANVYQKNVLVDPKIKTINQALAFLGVEKKDGRDEFDSVGLSRHRSTPDYLDKYVDLTDELGV